MEQIPYIVYEQAEVRHERTIKRLIAALIIAIVASNGAWLYCWMQYDYVETETSVELESDEGNANYIGNNGVINNGKSEGND